MKYLFTFFYLFSFFSLNAQGEAKIDFDEKLLESLEAYGDLEKVIEVSESLLESKSYGNAQKLARQWHTIAKSTNLKEQQAFALHFEGRALFGIAARDKNADLARAAAEKFTESNQLFTGSKRLDVQIKNLNYLQTLAKRAGKKKLVRKYRKEIKALNIQLLQQTKLNIGKREDLSNQEFLTMINDIVENPKSIEDENEELTDQLEAMGEEREELEDKLTLQLEAFDQLSKDQLESELLLSRQKQWVDSLNLLLTKDSLTILNKEKILQEQEAALALQRSQQNLSNALIAIFLLVAVGLFFRFWESRKYNRQLEEKNELVKSEQARSDQLLYNILPVSIANELKSNGQTIPRKHSDVSVLFSDFIAFSKISEQLTEVELIEELDYCFKAFDKIIRAHKLEKIKTIGDAYMCACGLPEPQEKHAHQTIRAAIAMQDWLKEWNHTRRQNGEPVFEARIGIHSGPVIAGVVGDDKFAYDIWGDAVNIAARIETASGPGQVNISAATYQCIKEDIPCLHRGEIPTKNLGKIDMYYVDLQELKA